MSVTAELTVLASRGTPVVAHSSHRISCTLEQLESAAVLNKHCCVEYVVLGQQQKTVSCLQTAG